MREASVAKLSDRRVVPDFRQNVPVSQILILARRRLSAVDLAVATDYYFTVSERLAAVPGSLGVTVWRSAGDAESFLVVYEYADANAAQRGLEAAMAVQTSAGSQLNDLSPTDLLRVQVVKAASAPLSTTPLSSTLSMSVRVAAPGYSRELLDELGRIFDELQLLPGCLGTLYGVNDALAEEVVGVVTWTDRASFQTSLPRGGGPSTIDVYDRFF